MPWKCPPCKAGKIHTLAAIGLRIRGTITRKKRARPTRRKWPAEMSVGRQENPIRGSVGRLLTGDQSPLGYHGTVIGAMKMIRPILRVEARQCTRGTISPSLAGVQGSLRGRTAATISDIPSMKEKEEELLRVLSMSSNQGCSSAFAGGRAVSSGCQFVGMTLETGSGRHRRQDERSRLCW